MLVFGLFETKTYVYLSAYRQEYRFEAQEGP